MAWYRGLTKYQWTILIVAWLGWVFDIFDTAIFNFTKSNMLKQMIGEEAYKLHGTSIEGTIQGIFLAGWALGGLLFGVLADKWGRTRTLVVTILIYSLFTGLTAFCQEPWQVAVARFITALGIGGEWAAGAALVAEVLPDRSRAGGAAVLQSAAAFGPALAAVAQLLLKNQSWHFMYWVGIVPALVCVGIRLWVKEPEASEKVRVEAHANPLRDLWSNPVWRKRALLAMVIGAVVVAGAGAATFWAPNLIEAANKGLDPAEVNSRKSLATMLSHVGTLLGVLLVPWLCERFGRKRTIGAFFCVTPLASIALASYGGVYGNLLFLLPTINFFAIGISAALALYFPELFPTALRATGAGMAYNVGRVFSIVLPIVMGIVIQQFSISVAFVLMAAIYVVGVITVPFLPETKGQPLPTA